MLPVSLPERIGVACEGLAANTGIFVAYSGGVDSQVLLHAVSKWRSHEGTNITALHLNHGLSPCADDWQEFCVRQCEALGISLLCERIDLGGISSGGLERRARDARYAWFESLLKPGDILLMAHHRDDQAETFVLRALRGSSARGLAAIPAARVLGKGRVLRPFLPVPKADIIAYARQQGLKWVEDESNLSLKFDRNYVRHQLMPVLAKRWPYVSRQFSRSAQYCGDDQKLLDELAAIDALSCQSDRSPFKLDLLPALNLLEFNAITLLRQRNLLRFLLRPLLTYAVPTGRVNEFLRQVNESAAAGQCQLDIETVSLMVYDGQLHCTPMLPAQSALAKIEWCTSSALVLPELGCELKLVPQARMPSSGVKSQRFEPGESVSVHWRQGGERIQLEGEDFSRSLKKIFQEKRLAPWLRRSMPLISIHGCIVWSALLGDFSPRLADAQGVFYSFELVSKC